MSDANFGFNLCNFNRHYRIRIYTFLRYVSYFYDKLAINYSIFKIEQTKEDQAVRERLYSVLLNATLLPKTGYVFRLIE